MRLKANISKKYDIYKTRNDTFNKLQKSFTEVYFVIHFHQFTGFKGNNIFNITLLTDIIHCRQGNKARKVNCGCVFSAYILKPVLFGRSL